MAKAPKNSPAIAGAITLAALVAATQSESGMLFAEPATVKELIDNGLAEMNTSVVNPNHGGEFAVRATPKGIEMNAASPNTNPAPADKPAKVAPIFLRMTVDEPTRPKRGGPGSGGLYPFKDLAAPVVDPATGKRRLDGFFIGATADKPKPWESLQSAVSAATRSFATITGTKSIDGGKNADGSAKPAKERNTYAYSRKFYVVEGDATDGDGKTVHGAWVLREQ